MGKREPQLLGFCPSLAALDLLAAPKAKGSSYYFAKLAKYCQGFGKGIETLSVKCSTNRKVKDQHM